MHPMRLLMTPSVDSKIEYKLTWPRFKNKTTKVARIREATHLMTKLYLALRKNKRNQSSLLSASGSRLQLSSLRTNLAQPKGSQLNNSRHQKRVSDQVLEKALLPRSPTYSEPSIRKRHYANVTSSQMSSHSETPLTAHASTQESASSSHLYM